MLFLMLGPIKILMPFVNMTWNSDAAFRRRLATRAVLFSTAALAVAGLLGRGMLDNFNISVSVLAFDRGPRAVPSGPPDRLAAGRGAGPARGQTNRRRDWSWRVLFW